MRRAEKLHITEGPVWIRGTTDEERALLDPLPEGVEIIDEPEPPQGSWTMAAAVIVVETIGATPELLDDTLPRVGSVPLVWIAVPAELGADAVAQIEAMAHEYGWSATEHVDLDASWSAVRLEQD